MEKVKVQAKICLLIALYFLSYYLYVGIQNPVPELGDSWDYHIPIANTILDGRFLHPSHFRLPQWYYPGSSEAINAVFILLGIPTLSNIFATVVLFFCLWKLGTVFNLKYYYALTFALTFVTLNVILRWLNAVSVDVWLGAFYALAIILLERPKKDVWYFVKLGAVIGMLIGTKYTALVFVLVLAVFFFKKIFPLLTISRILAFLVPFSFFGLFWYIRNYIFVHNPFYPLNMFGFTGPNIFGNFTVWNVGLAYPSTMVNAAFGEYKLWLFSIIVAVCVLVYRFLIKKQWRSDQITTLFLLGLINFLLFLTFVTSPQSWIMVSSFRYSFPVFIPLILGIFLLAQKHKKEELIGYIAIGNMIAVLSFAYYPKLVLFYTPFALLIFSFLQKHEKKRR